MIMKDISIDLSDDGVALTVPLDLVRGRVLRTGDLRVVIAANAALRLFAQLSRPGTPGHAVCEGAWSARDSDDSDVAIALEAWVDGGSARTVYVHPDGADEEVAFQVGAEESQVLYERIFWSAVAGSSA